MTSITMYAGGEVWMVRLMEALCRRGHAIHLVCRPDAGIRPYAELAGAEVFPMRIRGDLDPRTILRIRSIIRNACIDTIITNMDKELRIAGIAAKCAGGRIVINRKGVDRPLKNKWRYRFTYNVLTSVIVANSEATRRTILRSAPWLDTGRIHVIYNGIDIDRFRLDRTLDLRKSLGLKKNVLLAGFVGRLNCQKGIDTLLCAFDLVAKENAAIQLLIAGRGDLQEQVEIFIREHHLSSRVHLLGFRDDIPNIMRTIDFLVLPSLWEGFGIVLIEAMAAGKPCITTDISSMPEIVEENGSGFIVPPEDPESLAEAMRRLSQDPVLAARMGSRGREIVAERFEHSRMVDAYERLFDSLHST